MVSQQYIFEITDGGSAKRLEKEWRAVANRITKIGKTDSDVAPFATKIKKEFDSVTARAEKLKAEIATIFSALNKKGVPLSGEVADIAKTSRRSGFAGIDNKDKLRVEIALQDRILQLEDLRIERGRRLIAVEKRLASIQTASRVRKEDDSLVVTSRDLAKRVSGLGAGGKQRADLISERKIALANKEKEALLQLGVVRERLAAGTFGVGTALLEKEKILSAQILNITQKRVQAEKNIRKEQEKAAGKGLSGKAVTTSLPKTEKERAELIKSQVASTERLLALRREDSKLALQLTGLEDKRATNAQQLSGLERKGTATVGTSALLDRVLDINKAITRLDTDELQELNTILGTDLNASVDSLIARFQILNDIKVLDPEASAELDLLNREMRELIATSGQIAKKGIPVSFNTEDLIRGLPALERTLIGAFKGISQRFRTTLQFALSGALIFQVQRLAREFVSAAIEVERTFADVASSLTFDIEAPRGSAEFNRVLDNIRGRVLQIANDFNVLPTEVNKAAFVMISRFTDVDAALVATRAQMLATRVATISQGESLRALTGIAEVYGIQFAKISDATERQGKQAALYTQILDKATVIQQKFSSTVEDTLEGSVQLAENFRLLGFSIDETLAIVATSVVKTGQTGQAVSDRLARSIGQITSPQTKSDLLSLARVFDSFELTEADFASGQKAFQKILDQASGFDDALLARISSIIGQRRETAFVSSILGGASEIKEVLEAIKDSSGAAEARVAILLDTTQGALEGIKSAFFALAQNLESLGFLKPISILLKTLEFILNKVNEITAGINKLINRLNFVKLPSVLSGGLGNGLKIMLSLGLATLAFKRLIDAIKISRIVSGLTAARDAARGLAAIGTAEAAARGLVTTESAASTAAFVGFRKSIKVFVTKPLLGLNRVFPRVTSAFLALSASLTGTAIASATATAAENTLATSRTRAALVGFAAAFKQGGIFAGLLGTIGGAFTKAGAIMAKAFVALGVITTAFLASEGVKQLFNLPAAIFGAGSRRDITDETLTEEAEELVAMGVVSDVTAGKAQILTESIKSLGDALAETDTTLSDVAASFISIIPSVSEAELPGTEANAIRNISILLSKQVQVQIDAYTDAINKIYSNVNPSFGPINTEAGLLSAIESGVGHFAADFDKVREIQELLNDIGDPLDAPGDIGSQRKLFADLTRLDELFKDIPDAERLALESAIASFREVGSLQDLQQDLADLQSRVSLGRISPADARVDLAVIRDNFLELQKQAGALGGSGDLELVKQIDSELLGVAEQDLALFQQAASDRTTSFNLIKDVLLRQKAAVAGLRSDLDAAREQGFGSEIIRVLVQEIRLADREIAGTIKSEARQRLEFASTSADSIEERVSALKELRDAIKGQLRMLQFSASIFPDMFRVSAADEEELVTAEKNLADEKLQLAQLRAKNTVNSQASSLDSLRSIQANIAALRIQLSFMRQDVIDSAEINAVEIQLQDQITARRIAQADRRAAFFRLTAGAGDEIRSAQAGLRAALDRLSVIQASGAGETLAGFQAELGVLEAQERLAAQALTLSDINRRVASDLTDPYEQALLNVQAAQEALNAATGSIEKAQAQQTLAEAEAEAQKGFYDRQLSDLDFLFRTDKLGQASYIAALRSLQSGVDRTTKQGEDLWRGIELQILGLQDAAEQVFNIPTEIRLPTLFEVRRALAADALSVDYQDNRQQEINIFVSDNVEIDRVIAAIEDKFGSFIDVDAARVTAGGAGITIGSFG